MKPTLRSIEEGFAPRQKYGILGRKAAVTLMKVGDLALDEDSSDAYQVNNVKILRSKVEKAP